MWGLEQLWQRNQKAAGNPNPGQFEPEPPIVLDEEATARNAASVPWDEPEPEPRPVKVAVVIQTDLESSLALISHGLTVTDNEFGKVKQVVVTKATVGDFKASVVGFVVELVKTAEYVRLVMFWQDIASAIGAPGIQVVWQNGRSQRYPAVPHCILGSPNWD